MKRLFFLFITVFSLAEMNAQNITDALRYATEHLNGTARFNALSGAFGALGGDASAMIINPAGSAIFTKSSGSATFSVLDNRNKASYFETNTKASYAHLTLNQASFVFVFNNPKSEATINRFSIGLNYMDTNNFNNELFIKGTGDTSIGEFFLAQAQGIPLDLLQLQQGETISSLYSYLGENEGVSAQNAFLGYQGYILEPLDPENPENTQYYSNIAAGNFNQDYFYSTTGYSGKYTLNLGAQLNNKISLGVNLNTHTINYQQYTYLNERNNNPGSLVNQVGFENNLAVYGNGFSAQFGAIFKPLEALRLGITYDTPTWHNIYEETIQYLETQRVENGNTFNTYLDPKIINVFYRYKLRTPWKLAGSAAYIFGKKGLISFDYSYKDYSFTKFDTSYNDSSFASENNTIQNELKGSSSFKVGAEYRLKLVSLRGGYVFEESPYKNENTVGNLNGFSFGLGYYLGNYSIDLSYSRVQQDRVQQLYDVGLTSTAFIESAINNYTLGLTYKLN